MKIFYENLERIEDHNARNNETYRQGLNEDSDMSFEVKKARRSGTIMPKREKRSPVCVGKQTKPYEQKNITVPKSIDHSKYFPPVRNQGSCLSCWVRLGFFKIYLIFVQAFTAVAVVEYFLWRKGKRWTLSEQDLVDCSSFNHGCMGG